MQFRSCLPTPSLGRGGGFLVFAILYGLLIVVARYTSSHDPGSIFFDPSVGYQHRYSDTRLAQAESYLHEASNASDDDDDDAQAWPKASTQPTLCVGVTTIARSGVRYFKSTIGSLLAGLSERERADIHLVLFIAHTDPSEHPAYAEPWLHRLPDQVLLYNTTDVDVDHLRSLETEEEAKVSGREKPMFDYRYLLQTCHATGAPYTVMLEDDVVALDGWHHRTRRALAMAEQQTEQLGAPSCECGGGHV